MFMERKMSRSEALKRYVLFIISLFIQALGVAAAKTGEAFVKALSDTIHKDLANVKIAFDVSCVVLSVILSLMLFDFRIIGTREETLFAAIFTGVFVKLFIPMVKPIDKRLV